MDKIKCKIKNLKKCEKALKEIKKRETEITLLKKRIEFILGATKTGLDIIDSDYNIIYVDPSWQKTYGKVKERKCYKYFMGKTEPCQKCGLAEAKKTLKPVITEEFLTKEKRWIQVTTIPFKGENNQQLFAEVNVDITERKKAEDTVKESEEKFRTIFNGSIDSIFIADAKTRQLVDCNKQAELLTGYSKKEILSMKADELHPKDVLERTMEEFKKQASGKITIVETEVLAKGKRRVPVAINSAPITIGGKGYLQGIFRDVREQKESQERLKKMNEELKKRSEEAEKFNQFAIGRELKMIELKKEVNEFCKKLGEKPKYEIKTEK
jgi:PAS domain S-box-containing protein